MAQTDWRIYCELLNVLREAIDHGTFPKPLVGPGLR
jgi:hypothetical protein